jgi:hypothetical protein
MIGPPVSLGRTLGKKPVPIGKFDALTKPPRLPVDSSVLATVPEVNALSPLSVLLSSLSASPSLTIFCHQPSNSTFSSVARSTVFGRPERPLSASHRVCPALATHCSRNQAGGTCSGRSWSPSSASAWTSRARSAAGSIRNSAASTVPGSGGRPDGLRRPSRVLGAGTTGNTDGGMTRPEPRPGEASVT